MDTPTLLNTATVAVSQNYITSGSFSPAANALLIVVMECAAATAAARTPYTIADTFSPTLTWTKRGEVDAIGAASTASCAIFTAQTGSSPGSGTVTTTASATSNRISQHVIQIASGFNTSAPVKQSKTNSATGTPGALTVTFDAAQDTDSCTVAGIAVRGATTCTKDADFTELALTSAGGNHVGEICYDLNPTDATVGWTSTGLEYAGVAVEVDASAAAAGRRRLSLLKTGH